MKENKKTVVETTTEVTVDAQAMEAAARIEELLKEGKTLAEALQMVMPKAKAQRTVVDRVALIREMTNPEEIRAARKIAYAKKSKSKDKPDALARYQAEIDAATERLNEIIALINSSECPWKKALELGETPDGALQYWIGDTEIAVNEKLQELMTGVTKAGIKTFVNETKLDNFDFVPSELVESFKNRIKNNDQRARTLAQKMQAIKDLESGARKAPVKEVVSA